MKNIQNYYYLYINSDDNTDGLTNVKNLNFDLGSILQSAPNRQQIEDQAYCYVKMNYFGLNFDPINNPADTTLQVRVGGCAFPNSFQTRGLTSGNSHAIESSNILGLIPTKKVNNNHYYNEFLYSNPNYDNGYVVMGNIFKGRLNIQITDTDGELVDDTYTNGKSYFMKIEIYFPTDDNLYINN